MTKRRQRYHPGPSKRNRLRAFLKLRDKGRCRYCGEQGSTIDHVVPQTDEGTSDAFSNLVWSCATCNNVKGRELGFSMRTGRLYWHGRLVASGHTFGAGLLEEIRNQRTERQLAQGLTFMVRFKERGAS